MMFDYIDETHTHNETAFTAKPNTAHNAAAVRPARPIETYCPTLAERRAAQEAAVQTKAASTPFASIAAWWHGFMEAFVGDFASAGQHRAGPVTDICRFRKSMNHRAASVGWLATGGRHMSGSRDEAG
ncbi:MAG: hypothetical protein ACR2OR_16495 [Hyphomicrobiales bacterium]